MLHTFITVFLAFFAIMNPIANTAVFMGLVEGTSKEEQVKIARKSLLTAFLIIVFFAILGKVFFHIFGITLTSLRITGGILVFIIGYHMLQGENSSLHKIDSDKSNIAISPLALPLLAGPGTIATAMNFSASGDLLNISITIFSFASLSIITYLFFIFGQKTIVILGKDGLNIVTRLMGLILAMVGVQMLIVGIQEILK